jgi:hypothetical protein
MVNELLIAAACRSEIRSAAPVKRPVMLDLDDFLPYPSIGSA